MVMVLGLGMCGEGPRVRFVKSVCDEGSMVRHVW